MDNKVDSSDLERMRRVLGHRLVNVASGIKAAAGYLSVQMEERLSPREREYFPLIQQQCDEVCYIVKRMNLLFGKVDSPAPLPFYQAFESAICVVRKECPGLELRCEYPSEECLFLVCPLTLTTVLEEAVRNARQSTVSPVVIAVTLTDQTCILRVIDQGEGFNEEAAQQAFDMFFTTRARAMGLGLAIARRLVQEQGGRVALGQEPRGNYVEFVLPLNTRPVE